jgi:hypothetical protein
MPRRADNDHPGGDQQECRHHQLHLHVKLQDTGEEQQLKMATASKAPAATAVASRTDRVGGSHLRKASATGMSVKN